MTDTIQAMGVVSYFRGSEVWVRPAAVRAILSAENLTGAVSVPDLRQSKAARAARAAHHFSNARVRIALIGEQPKKFDTEVSFSVTKLVKEPGRKAEYLAFDRVTWADKTGWKSENGTDEAIEFIRYAERWQTHLDYSWVRLLGMEALKACDAISLPGGGVYYVHTDKMDDFRKYQRAIDQIDGARLVAVQVDGTDQETRSALAEAAADHLVSQVRSVIDSLMDWRSKVRGQRGTLVKMMAELAEIRGRATVYAVGLGAMMDRIEAELVATEKVLEEELAQMPDTDGSRVKSGRAPRAKGGAILDQIIAGIVAMQKSEFSVGELADFCEEQGIIAPRERTMVRTLVSGRLSDVIEAADPRFRKVARGRFQFSADGTWPEAEPEAEVTVEPEAEVTVEPEAEVTVEDDDVPNLYGEDPMLDASLETVIDTDYIDTDEIPMDIDTLSDDEIRMYADAHGIPCDDLDLAIERLIDMREQQASA